MAKSGEEVVLEVLALSPNSSPYIIGTKNWPTFHVFQGTNPLPTRSNLLLEDDLHICIRKLRPPNKSFLFLLFTSLVIPMLNQS